MRGKCCDTFTIRFTRYKRECGGHSLGQFSGRAPPLRASQSLGGLGRPRPNFPMFSPPHLTAAGIELRKTFAWIDLAPPPLHFPVLDRRCYSACALSALSASLPPPPSMSSRQPLSALRSIRLVIDAPLSTPHPLRPVPPALDKPLAVSKQSFRRLSVCRSPSAAGCDAHDCWILSGGVSPFRPVGPSQARVESGRS